jgi:hypothetical protein
MKQIPDNDSRMKRFIAVKLHHATNGMVNIPFHFNGHTITDCETSECGRFQVAKDYYLAKKERFTPIPMRQAHKNFVLHPHFIGDWDRAALLDYSCAIENSGDEWPEPDFMPELDDDLQRRILFNTGDFASKLVFKSDAYLVINSIDSQCDLLLVVDRLEGVFCFDGENHTHKTRRQ